MIPPTPTHERHYDVLRAEFDIWMTPYIFKLKRMLWKDLFLIYYKVL